MLVATIARHKGMWICTVLAVRCALQACHAVAAPPSHTLDRACWQTARYSNKQSSIYASCQTILKNTLCHSVKYLHAAYALLACTGCPALVYSAVTCTGYITASSTLCSKP